MLLFHPRLAALQPLEEMAAAGPSAVAWEKGLIKEPGSGRGLWSGAPVAGEDPLPPDPGVQSHQP